MYFKIVKNSFRIVDDTGNVLGFNNLETIKAFANGQLPSKRNPSKPATYLNIAIPSPMAQPTGAE